MRVARLEESLLAERLEDRLELARHVHLEHERLCRDPLARPDLERGHDGRSEERADRLLDVEVEQRLHLRAHGERAGALRVHERPHAGGEAEHPRLRLAGRVALDVEVRPEPLVALESLPRGLPGHARRDEEHVDAVRHLHEIVRQRVARSERDRGADP